MNEEEKSIIEEKLIECYKMKGITFDDESLYKEENFKSSSDMPILEDLYNLLGNTDDTKIFKIKLMPFIKGSLKFLNNHTNIQIDNKLIVADIFELGEENIKYRNVHFYRTFLGSNKKGPKSKKIYIFR